MSAFDAQVNVVNQEVLFDDTEGQAAGFQVALTLGIVVPMATPQGVQAAMTSFGTLRYTVTDREAAEKLGNEILEAAGRLPRASALGDLTIASNMSQVEDAARRMQSAQSGVVR